MKKFLFLTAALSFGLVNAQATTTATVQAPDFRDIPAGHWAQSSVDRLASLGIVMGFPDGTFRGNNGFTRYEAAMVINRLLDYIQDGTVSTSQLDPETLEALQNAIVELASQGVSFDERIALLENQDVVSREEFDALVAEVAALSTGGNNDETTAKVNELDTLIGVLDNDVLTLKDQVAKNSTDLATLSKKVEATEGVSKKVDDLANARVSITSAIGGEYAQIIYTKGKNALDVDRITNGTFANKAFTNGKTPYDITKKKVKTPASFGVSVTDAKSGNIVVEKGTLSVGINPYNLAEEYEMTSPTTFKKKDSNNRYLLSLDGVDITGHMLKGDEEAARFRGVAHNSQVPVLTDITNKADKVKDTLGYSEYLLPSGVFNGMTVGATMNDVPLKPAVYLTVGDPTNDGAAKDDDLKVGNMKGNAYFGGRMELKPLEKATLSTTFFQNNTKETAKNAGQVVDPNLDGRTTVAVEAGYKEDKWGVNAGYTYYTADVFAAQEYMRDNANSKATYSDLFEKRKEALKVTANADLELAGNAVKLNADGRMISDDFNTMDIQPGKHRGADTNGETDEVGFGLTADTTIKAGNMGLKVGAAADTYTDYKDKSDWKNQAMTVGGHVGAELPKGFSAIGFGAYSTKKDAGTGKTEVEDVLGKAGSIKPIKLAGSTTDLYKYTSSVGAMVSHDGSKKDALVKNLNLALADNYFYDTGSNVVSGHAAYNYNSPDKKFSVKPFANAMVFNYKENKNKADILAFNYGTEANANLGDLGFVKPSLKLNAAGQNVNLDSDINSATTKLSAAEYAAKAEVIGKNLFGSDLQMSLGYGVHYGDNIDPASASIDITNPDRFKFGFGAPKTDEFADAKFQDKAKSTTHGIFTQLKWNALSADYGYFMKDQDVGGNKSESAAHAFKIKYGLKF